MLHLIFVYYVLTWCITFYSLPFIKFSFILQFRTWEYLLPFIPFITNCVFIYYQLFHLFRGQLVDGFQIQRPTYAYFMLWSVVFCSILHDIFVSLRFAERKHLSVTLGPSFQQQCPGPSLILRCALMRWAFRSRGFRLRLHEDIQSESRAGRGWKGLRNTLRLTFAARRPPFFNPSSPNTESLNQGLALHRSCTAEIWMVCQAAGNWCPFSIRKPRDHCVSWLVPATSGTGRSQR